MIRYSKYYGWLCLFLVSLITLVQPIDVFADVMSPSNAFVVNADYLIGSASNANSNGFATFDLYNDSGVSTFSSIGTVVSTIDFSDAYYIIYQVDLATEKSESFAIPLDSDGGFSYIVPEGKSVLRSGIRLYKNSLPRAGVYDMQLSFASDLSQSYSLFRLSSVRNLSNANSLDNYVNVSADQLSGDVYYNGVIDLGSITSFTFYWLYENAIPAGSAVGGYFDVSFTISSSEPDFTTVGSGLSDIDYESDVSSSLSDISSSIGDMSSSLDSAAENLEYISTSQNLIIQGIDNVIMHISDQLYAFWDQLYNLIHEPTYARLGDILDAIRNLDLEITVEMTEVTNAVNKMNQEVQNKLQNVQQTLTGGYDSSSMDSDNQELNSSLNEYEAVENELFDDAKENINSFEFDTDFGEFSTPLTDISYFLGSLFVGLGPMNVVISFSLTLTIAMVLIGWYRFKGGS